ncbi:MAG: hypothetical protein JW795_00210 [Chitinivibrionales bacterium]|nr:hypothetical protein [Chitinivibrionales bacterium]
MRNFVCIMMCFFVTIGSAQVRLQFRTRQMPDIKGYFDGWFNFQCTSSATRDSAATILDTTYYRYLSSGLPDSVKYKDFDPLMPATAEMRFAYDSAHNRFERHATVSMEPLFISMRNLFHYDEKGKILSDSCFDPQGVLYYSAKYEYLSDDRLSMICSKNVESSTITIGDTVRWIYNSKKRIDSVNTVWYENDTLESQDIYLPTYDGSNRIVSAVKLIGTAPSLFEKSFCTYHYATTSLMKNFFIVASRPDVRLEHTLCGLRCFSPGGFGPAVFFEIFDCRGRRMYRSERIQNMLGGNEFTIDYDNTQISAGGRYFLQVHDRSTTLTMPFYLLK